MYKLIIIEDEKLTRDGIEHMINSRDTGFEVAGVASDGEQGLKLIYEKNPDVIITDIYMPKINGLDLIENALDINPETIIIIISGYDDFNYAQKAVRLGVREYFLKPVLPEQLYEILLKTRDELDQRRSFMMNVENLKSRVRESLPILRERFFNDLISGRLSEEQIDDKLKYLDIDMTGGIYTVILLKIISHDGFSVQEVRKEDFLQFFLLNAIDQVFDKNTVIYPVPVSDSLIALILCIKREDYSNVFMMVNQNTARIVAKIRKYLDIRAYASIGKLYRQISDIKKSYDEACEAMNYTFSKDSGCVVNYEDISLHEKVYVEKPVQHENQLFVAIKLGDRETTMSALENIFAVYERCGVDNIKSIKIEILEIVMLLTRSIEETGLCSPGFYQLSQMESYENILKCETPEELKKQFTGFIDVCINEYTRAKLSRGEVIAEKVKEYVNACLGDEDFSLDKVAEKLFMSPNYLRRIFKQHTGSSFVDYLTAKRMEKAAALLQIKSLKIQDISEKVGFSNQRYFASCFKKHYSLSPSDYRDAQPD